MNFSRYYRGAFDPNIIIILISAGIFKDTYHTNLYFTSANLTISFDLSSFFSL